MITKANAVVIIAASAGYRLRTIDLPAYAVVITSQGATVRFEPSTTGTAHFEAKTGVVLRVLAERQGWAQVSRADGTRGWVSADTIARL